MLNLILASDEVWREYVGKHHSRQSGLGIVPLHMFPATEFVNNTGPVTLEVTVNPFSFLEGGSLPTDLALLNILAGSIPDCSYFEIGTWRGESVANVARYARECFTLNLSPRELEELGHSAEYIEAHAYFSKDLPNVTHLYGDSRSFDFEGPGRKFDLVFIDGDHHYEMVKNDTEKVFRHLVHEKTIVVWHDYAHNPESIRYEVLAGILDGLPDGLQHRLYHAANTKCAVYYPADLPVKELIWPSRPETDFRLLITLTNKG